MRIRARHGAAALLASSILLTLAGPSEAAPDPARGPAPEVVLVEQSAISPPGSTFVARLQLPGVPADGSVQIVVHQRVRSRSELALSMEGEGLRSEVLATVKALSTLPAQPDGTRRLTLSLDPASGGLPLSTEGVYPVELIAQDAASNPLATLVTHLIVPPAVGDDAPSLGVAVVAQVSAPPALQPDGTVALSAADVEAMTGVVAGLGAAPTVPASIAARPETIDALLGSAEPGYAELVDALRAVTAGRTVLAEPYVEVSPDALVPAGLFGEISEQVASGRAVLTDELGVDPVGSVALSPPALGAAGMAALTVQGVPRVVVASDQVEPLDPGIISYSLAQPFVLAPPEDTADDAAASLDLQAFATDPQVVERLTTDGSPGLVASRVLAELALLRLEQPSVARSMILPLDPATRGEVVRLVLHGIGAGRPFAPMTLDQAFDHAGPLLDGGGNPVERAAAARHPRGHHPGRGARASGRSLGPRHLPWPRRGGQPQHRTPRSSPVGGRGDGPERGAPTGARRGGRVDDRPREQPGERPGDVHPDARGA